MDLTRHWRSVRRERRLAGRAYAQPEVALAFREAMMRRLPDRWRESSNTDLARTLNGMGLLTFEGRTWDASSARTFRMSVAKAEVDRAARASAMRNKEVADIKVRLAKLAAASIDPTCSLAWLEYDLMWAMEDRKHPAVGDLATKVCEHVAENLKARRANARRASAFQDSDRPPPA